jgi:hypothetical protein
MTDAPTAPPSPDCAALLAASGARASDADLAGVRALYARFAADRARLSAAALNDVEPLPIVALPKPTQSTEER